MACKDKGELSKPYREKNQLMSLIFIFLMLYQNTARCNLYEYSPVKQQCSNTQQGTIAMSPGQCRMDYWGCQCLLVNRYQHCCSISKSHFCEGSLTKKELSTTRYQWSQHQGEGCPAVSEVVEEGLRSCVRSSVRLYLTQERQDKSVNERRKFVQILIVICKQSQLLVVS